VFPFLIGRIRTEKNQEKVEKDEMFPFLIGRIRTVLWEKLHKETDFEFPFLIGRIRTREYEATRKSIFEGFHSS